MTQSWRGTVDRRNGVIHAQYAVSRYTNLTLGTVGAQETRGFVRFFDETGGACNQVYHFKSQDLRLKPQDSWR